MDLSKLDYSIQYQKWHKDSNKSFLYDIEENINFLNTHNIFPENKKSCVLELGCGMGRMMAALNQCGYENTKGVDIDKSQIDIAAKYGLNVIKKDVLSFLIEDKNKYDIVYCLDLLEHIDKNEQINLLKEINKHLNNNGKLVLRVPNALCPVASYFRYIDFTHNVSYTEDSIGFILHNAGFSNYLVRAQHFEDDELCAAKNNYAYILYKQFGLTNPVLTPNIVVVVFKDVEDKKRYIKTTKTIFNDYQETINCQKYEMLRFVHLLNNKKQYYFKHKYYDFLSFLTFGLHKKSIERKIKYRKYIESIKCFESCNRM